MANVQAEHGFTKVANELLEVVMQQKLNGTQFKIIMAVWRFTYGFSRKEHDLSLTFLSKSTGVHKQQIKTELAKLIEKKIINVIGEASYTTSRKLSFNKNYDEWIDLQEVKTLTVSESSTTTVSENTYTTVSELTTTTVSESTYQERNNKENIKENINKGFLEFWSLYPRKKKRVEAEKKYNTHATSKKMHDRIISGLKSYLKEIEQAGTKEEYILYPTTFLNQKKYLDGEVEEKQKENSVDPMLVQKLIRIDELMDLMDEAETIEEFKEFEREREQLKREVSKAG